MASKSSRWATTEDDAAAEVQRRRDKEAKKRAKEEKARKAAEAASTETPATNGDVDEPAAKRQRRSPAPDGDVEEGANLLRMPTRSFGPCGSIDEYEFLNSIEEGSYGKVSRARLKESGQVVALKKLKIDNTHDGFPITGLREIHTLRSCSHTHIVDIYEVVTGSTLSE